MILHMMEINLAVFVTKSTNNCNQW